VAGAGAAGGDGCTRPAPVAGAPAAPVPKETHPIGIHVRDSDTRPASMSLGMALMVPADRRVPDGRGRAVRRI